MSNSESIQPWSNIIREVANRLSDSDDPQFWAVAIAEIYEDAQCLCIHSQNASRIFTEIGACSRWQRPHQHRWMKDGGFAAPYGYGGSSFNIHALPNFDWSLNFSWNLTEEGWTPVCAIVARRPLTLRVALPTRTGKHQQAAIHTLWTPGSPTTPDRKRLRLYGFRKADDQWKCTATQGDETSYEIPLSDQ
jgi:hypothetical protein